jgi:hypothetical protein
MHITDRETDCSRVDSSSRAGYAVAVGAAYRRRHREPSGAAVSHSAFDATRAHAQRRTSGGHGAWNTPPAPAGAPRGSESSLHLSPGSALIGYITVAAASPSSIQAALGYRRPRARDQLPSPQARPTP